MSNADVTPNVSKDMDYPSRYFHGARVADGHGFDSFAGLVLPNQATSSPGL
jgi:hypothetical protein